MIAFDEALDLLEQAVEPLPSEMVSLDEAADRHLATDLAARSDAPRRAVSAMDGYAVIEAEARSGTWLTVTGEVRAGSGDPAGIAAGQAARIFTGAPVPEGADCVVMQEYAEADDGRVRFREGFGPARHIRTQGSDFRAGATLLGAGTRLSPRAMVAAAAADRSEVQVHHRPKVAIIATGDELAPPGRAHAIEGALPESASYGVAALAETCGARVVSRSRGGDELGELETLAEPSLATADVVVVTGGASVGKYDLAKAMFGSHGLEQIFAKLAIKPGKPVWFGKARGRLVLGLPGNPTSAMVTARLFLQPIIAALQGGTVQGELKFLPMPVAEALPANGSRENFVRAQAGKDGLLLLGNQESGSQAPLASADWLIRVPADHPGYAAGEMVQALRF